MLNEVRQRVTTYPGTAQVVTTPGESCNDHDWPFIWDALNVLYHMHYIYTRVSWNIQRKLQHPQNISFLPQNRLIRPLRYSFTK